MLVAARSTPPHPAGLVEIIADDGAGPVPGTTASRGGESLPSDRRFTSLLTLDPDIGLTAAAHWIATAGAAPLSAKDAFQAIRTHQPFDGVPGAACTPSRRS
ncbi:hypothetical protein [Streptomyces sp. NTH33]|uniref:hypothetical protein n=1 Tax=Streptomyces sp. NTH33 TaxID=1735453 RepID=UPI0011B93BD9|nr:hypothetical protein [Streptomyces sp. NTH33]